MGGRKALIILYNILLGFLIFVKKGMATVIIKGKSKAAKVMLEFLKTQPYAEIVEEDEPNEALQKSFDEAKTGKTTTYESAHELITKLRKDIQCLK